MKTKGTYNILHISDLHFHSKTPEKIINEFVKSIVSTTSNFEENKFDFVFITGDIFNGGIGIPPVKETDKISLYQKAVEEKFIDSDFAPNIEDITNNDCVAAFINELKKYSKNTFITYGNHDMKVRLMGEKIENRDGKELLMGEKIIRTFGDESDWQGLNGESFFGERTFDYNAYKKYITPFINSLEFKNKIQAVEKNIFFNYSFLFAANKHLQGTKLFTTGVFFNEEENPDIAIVVLNSAWLNVDSQKCHGQLVIGKQILDDIIDALVQKNMICADKGTSKSGKYVISLLHNDFNWHSILDHHNFLQNEKESSIRKISNFSDIILCGHEHKESKPTLLDLNSYLFKTGGTFKTDGNPDNTFSVFTLNFYFNKLTRDLFEYNHSQSVWEEKKDLKITTELKPLDASKNFNKPYRTAEQVFEIMKANGYLSAEDFGLSFREYIAK